MNKQKIYIETAIPSYLFETREDPEAVVKKNWTWDWWNNFNNKYELFTSAIVIEELENGHYPGKKQALDFIKKIQLFRLNQDIIDIAKVYIDRFVMPKETGGDAFHLAISSYYNCYYLLTWNCRHLANANKFEHIRHVNNTLCLFVPTLITPYQLIYEEET